MKHKIIILFLTIAFCGSVEKTYSQYCNPGYWYGYTSHTVTNSSITIYWSVADSGLARDDSYRVRHRLYGTNDPWSTSGSTTGGSQTITNLTYSTTYEVEIDRYCNNNYRDTSRLVSGIQTAASQTYTYTTILTGASNLKITYYGYNPPGTNGNMNLHAVRFNFDYGYSSDNKQVSYRGESVFYRLKGSTQEIRPDPYDTQHQINNMDIYNLASSTSYLFVVRTYFYVEPTSKYVTGTSLFIDSSVVFTTPPAPGPCSSIAGNYTAPPINNDGYTDFYSGTITSASSVTQSTATHTFKSTGIYLNQGFTTSVSGTGGLIIRTFDPTNCATAKTSGATKTHTVSGLNNLTVEAVAKEDIQEQKKGIKVYPNPTTGILNIHSDAADEIIKQVAILSEAGQTVLSENGSKENVDISKLANGLYIYKVETNQGSYTGKVIKK